MSSHVWVAVPGGKVETIEGDDGASRKVAVLRVLIVPRLTEPLAGTAMEDWPTVINRSAPIVEVRLPGESSDRTVKSRLRAVARRETWSGFFGQGMEVKPFALPPTPIPPEAGPPVPKLRVTPTLQREEFVQENYRAAAERPGEATVDPEQILRELPEDEPPAPPLPEPRFEKVDFHRAVSLLREHPYVLRMLGLIVELELETDAELDPDEDAVALPESPPEADPAARVRVRWPGSPIPIVSPWTAYQHKDGLFFPAAGGDISSGVVDLDTTDKWAVITMDVDGAVGKLREGARSALEAGDTAQFPSLRSAGMQLVRRNRLAQLQNRGDRGRSNAASGSLDENVFFAHDLVLGYRIDVRPEKGNKWFSLHARRATYRIDGRPVGDEAVVDEEGHLKPHAVVRDDSGLHADEVVARWSGWSLAVPMPNLDRRDPVARPTEAAATKIPYRFTMEFDVAEGTLPELLFGKGYQLRVRVVDSAGGGLGVDDGAADAQPTRVIPYLRYDPVPPPELVVPDGLLAPDPQRPETLLLDPGRLGPGGTLECLVVRSTPTDTDIDTAEFDDQAAYPANDRRAFAPPATTLQLAEQHGVLSASDEEGRSRARRAIDPALRLPDPTALGAAVALMPEPGDLTAVDSDTRPWAGDWPDQEPKHIVLVPGRPDAGFSLEWAAPDGQIVTDADAEASTARVIVPPGHRVTVELSSTIRVGNVGNFALKKFISADDLQSDAANGRHPILTPPRLLELVHAVRTPLRSPSGTLASWRPEGATFAVLRPDAEHRALGLHTQSTAQVDLKASWEEWGDAPDPVDRSAPLPPVTVSYGAEKLPQIHHELGDTKHRMVTYTATAVSRYRHYFAETDDEKLFKAAGTFEPVSVPSSARPAPPVIVSTVPAFAWTESTRPEGGLMLGRSGGRLRIELGRPWFTTGEGECVGVVLWPGSEDGVPPEVAALVSWVNRDPIHPTPTPKALADESMFRGAVEPLDVLLAETGHTVRLLPYPVFFADGWYADIDMSGAANSSYSPFVHLAIARFQRQSLKNLSVSTVVRTDMVPLLPDRSLTVHTEPDGLHITLEGLSREGDRPNRVTATIESCDAPDVPGAPVELTSLTGAGAGFPAWVRVPGASVSGRTNQELPTLPVPTGDDRLRLVVREVEDIPANPLGAEGTPGELAERTVYADVVSLPLG